MPYTSNLIDKDNNKKCCHVIQQITEGTAMVQFSYNYSKDGYNNNAMSSVIKF